jgi:hypothetical protein
MALDSLHPQYQDMSIDWIKVRDVFRGERHVKAKGREYLPPTKGMLLDGYGKLTLAGSTNLGVEAYEAYKLRAVLPDYVQEFVEGFMGLLHSNPPVIELPPQLEPMREKATQLGEPLELLLYRINEEQLVTGRLGLMLDMPAKPDPANPMPYIALYVSESVTNWDDGEIQEGRAALNFVVLNESGNRRNRDFEWNWVSKYRVLELEPQYDDDGAVVGYGGYRQGVFVSDGEGVPPYVASDMFVPAVRGGGLDVVPFVFINTKDLVASPDKPPALGLADACLTIYRGEADYRQNLFMQGQDTLVVKGDLKVNKTDPNELKAAADAEPVRLGTGAMIHLEGGADNDAKMIGVSSTGLAEQRSALENDRKRAEGKSTALAADATDSQASGEALKTRVGSRTASLNQIARSGAAGLEWILQIAAKWIGADPLAVKVTPNMEFADFQLDGATLAAIMAAKRNGAPISYESIHKLMNKGNLTELTYDDEKKLLDEDREDDLANAPPAGTQAGGNPGDDEKPPAGPAE